MRHFCLTGSTMTLACGMFKTTPQAFLIAFSSFFQGLSSRQFGAVTGTVALSTITVATDQYRCVTAGAKIVSGGRFHRQQKADGGSTESGDSWNTTIATSPVRASGARHRGELAGLYRCRACIMPKAGTFLPYLPHPCQHIIVRNDLTYPTQSIKTVTGRRLVKIWLCGQIYAVLNNRSQADFLAPWCFELESVLLSKR